MKMETLSSNSFRKRLKNGCFLSDIYIYISFKLSFCCLEVVCAGIYFDLKNKGYSLSACLSTKGVLSYLKPYTP